MPWQTVDARPQKRRTGDAVEDAERRELRLRRTYNEAAAGHAALAAKAASAPPADAVAALYEKILEDVGSAAKENEAPWDAALRLACARHLSELLEAAGDRAGALAAAAGPPTPDGTTPGCGCASRASRESRRASPRRASPSARPARGRAAARRAGGRRALERAARAVGVKRACFRGVAADAAPRRRRLGRCAPRDVDGPRERAVGGAAALARDARAGRATLDHPWPWSGSQKKKAEAAQAKKPAEAPGDEKADEGKDDEKRPRRGARRRGAAPTEEKRRTTPSRSCRSPRASSARSSTARPPKPPDGVAAAWFARAPAAPGAAAAAAAAPPSFAAPRRVRDHPRRSSPRRRAAEAAWAADDARKVFAEAVAAVDGAWTRPRSWRSPRSIVPRRARGLDPRTADAPDPAARLHWLAAEGAAARATLLLRGPSSTPARGAP